ncbi:MAG: hypothetical protein JNL56_08315 [Alphaproteobacteria bacterium]|nr:hypothetical protein [Alphaproteobacteria bacterium]
MSPPVKPSYRRLAIAILVPLTLLLVAWYASRGEFGDLGGARLRLTVAIEGPVTLSPRGQTAMEARLTLQNRTGSDIPLKVDGPCRVVRWVVQTMADDFVQSKGEACAPEPDTITIAAAQTIERRETILLDSARFKPGVSYRLTIQFWGETSSADFTTAD